MKVFSHHSLVIIMLECGSGAEFHVQCVNRDQSGEVTAEKTEKTTVTLLQKKKMKMKNSVVKMSCSRYDVEALESQSEEGMRWWVEDLTAKALGLT